MILVRFIDDHRERFGVEPICRVLSEHGYQIAPSSYYAVKNRKPSARVLTDAAVLNVLHDLADQPEGMYGRRKMWHHLRRQGHQLPRCTVERLMADLGMRGVVRGKKVRTTIHGKDGIRAGDRLNRNFTAEAPNRAWVADFTYVATWAGMVYVAFAIDVFSRAIVGWAAARTKHTDLVLTTLQMGLWRRDHAGHTVSKGLVHHSDAGSQYTSIRFTESLMLSDITASIGSVGDAYDNALAESTIGLFKTEVVRRQKAFKTLDDVEYATFEWVDWYNNHRLHSTLDYLPPAEYEANYYAGQQTPQPASVTT